MDRREFLSRTGVIAAAVGTKAELAADLKGATAKRAGRSGSLDLSNDAIAWHLEWRNGKLFSPGFDNKLTGTPFKFTSSEELVLTLSSSEQRIEIPNWSFTYGPDLSPVAPEIEKGLGLGFHKRETPDDDWGATQNLLLRSLVGVKRERGGIVYDGYGWFRRWFDLPPAARGTQLVFVLGGYDHQDWNEYWIYANGLEIGHRVSSGRWRTPGQFTLAPNHPAYSSLRFGEQNLLAVRTRGFDKHFGGLSDEVLKHYVYEPVWADQLISVGPPYLQVSDFEIREIDQQDATKVAFGLQSLAHGIRATAHYDLEGPTRRKWLEIENASGKELLLLDVQVDDFATGASTSEGGAGAPVFIADQAFSAFEHPAGLNAGDQGRVRLVHFPARRLRAGEKMRSHVALCSVAKTGEALDRFTRYVQERSPRPSRALSLFTPYGINNQWGGCPPLTDDETLYMLDVVEKWQQKEIRFEYFTLDQGWMDPTADLTKFAPQCYPEGPGKMLERVKSLGMKFGLWFSVSGAGWSCGENPAVRPSFIPGPREADESAPTPAYRNGYIANGGVSGQLCVASEPYFGILRDAVLYHIRKNGLKFFKLDIGSYYCNSTQHNHLPGKYSVEAMYERLLDLAAAARNADPEVYVMWYWGVRSPFFALHGNSVFESGLFMEGAGTTWIPTLYFRDSVTLNLDQSTQFASTLPPINKDSLGVWLAEIRWGNFMGSQRWRESLIMDLGRGNLLFPQFWGDIKLLDEKDVDFLAEINSLVKKNESVFLRRKNILGDPWKNEVYGYANVQGDRGFLFVSNVHFTSRRAELKLGAEVGLEAPAGTPLQITSVFPEKASIQKEDGSEFRTGDTAGIWMRPFEVLMLEVGPAGSGSASTLVRKISDAQAGRLGLGLTLQPSPQAEWMNIGFADASRFEQLGFKRTSQAWASTLPQRTEGTRILAISIRLREGSVEWRYSPGVVEIVQVVARIGAHKVQMIPVPDARQYGNTQKMGCSWVVYKLRLNPEWAGENLQLTVQSYLPATVEAKVEAWVVEQWWEAGQQPLGDGYYGDEPS